MREMDELSSGIQRLKKNSEGQKRVIEQLEKDRAFLMERTRFLSQKLSEAYVIYEEAGKRILDFVDKETAPIKNQIADIKADVKRLSVLEQELKSHSVTIEKMKPLEHELKLRITENEKAIRRINETAASLRTYVDGLKESENRDEQAIDAKVAEMKSHMESRLKTAEEKLNAKIAESTEEVMQDSADSINVLSASHEVLRKRISEGELSIRHLKSGTVDIRKQMDNAGLARQEIEKKITAQHVSLREAESSITKMERRLNGISLEDDKLEKRLAELRRISHEEVSSKADQLRSHVVSVHRKQLELIDSRSGQMKLHIEAQHKRQNETLDSKIAEFASQVQVRISTLNQRLSAREHAMEKEIAKLRRQARLEDGVLADRLDKNAVRLEKMLKQEHAAFELEKSKVQKNLSVHLSSISGLHSSISKIQKSLDSINLEDADLENRLAEVRKNAHQEIDAKTALLRDHVESSQRKTLENLDARIKSLTSDFHSRASVLNEKLIAENERINSGLQELASKFTKKMDDERSQDLRFEKHLAETLRVFEGTIDEKIAKFRLHSDASQKKHADALGSRLSSLSDDIDGRMGRLKGELAADNEKLKLHAENSAAKMSERLLAETTGLETKLEGKLDSRFSVLSKRLDGIKLEDDKLEKRLSDLRKEQSELTVTRISSLSDHVNSKADALAESIAAEKVAAEKGIASLSLRIAKSIDGIKLEDGKLEKRLAALRKSAQEEIAEKAAGLKSELALAQKGQAERMESRFGSMSDEMDAKISGIRESVSAEGQQLKARMDDSFVKINDRLLLEKSRSGKRLEDFEGRVVKRLEAIKHSDDRFDERLSESFKVFEGTVDDKVAKLKAHADASQKRHAELLDSHLSSLSQETDGRIARMSERLDSEGARIQKEAALSVKEMSRRLDGIKLEDGKFEKHLAGSLRQFEGVIDARMQKSRTASEAEHKAHLKMVDSRLGSLSGRLDERMDADISRISKRLDSIKLDDASLEKRMSEVKRSAEESIDSKHRKQLELLDAKMLKASDGLERKFSALGERVDASVSTFGKRIDSTKAEDGKFEKRLDVSLKGFESQFDGKMQKLRLEVGAEQKSHIKAIDSRLSSLSDNFDDKIEANVSRLSKRLDGIKLEDDVLEKRLSETRMHSEALVNSSHRKQAELIASRMDEIAGKLDAKLSAEREKIAAEKVKIADVRSYVAKKVDDSQRTLASKISGLDSDLQKRFAQVYSHVASEKKSTADLRLMLEKEIREEQKALSGKMAGITESNASRLSGLSEEVVVERKALAEERQKFSGRLADENRALSVLSASVKSLESGLKETRALASEKSKGVESEIAGKVSKLQTQIDSDRKDLGQRFRLAESGIRTLSSEISGLKKGLQDDTGADASVKRRVLDMESGMKKLASSVAGIESSVKAINADTKRRLDAAASSDAGLDKQAEKSQETIRQLVEASKASHDLSRKRIETLESAVRMLSEKLSRNEKAMEKHIGDVQEKLTKNDDSKIRSKESEIKGYVDSTLKTRYENEVARMRAEMASLKKELSEWKDEQNKLYELLKEDS